MLRYLIVLLNLLIIGYNTSNAQRITKYSIFKKSTLAELQQNSFDPLSDQTTTSPIIINTNVPTAYDIVNRQNQLMLQKMGMIPGQNLQKQKQEEAIEEIRKEEIMEKQAWLARMEEPFANNYQEFLKMSLDSFSVSKAIYLSESAWYNKPPTYEQFQKEIKLKADEVKILLKKEGLSLNNTSINYGIQKLYEQDNQFITKSKQIITIKRLGYDFDDFEGKKNYANMFVTKLLATGKGQCHSLPLLYLCISEQLGGKAYLSMAPQHQFIQFFDQNGYRYNYETTSGHLVTQTWLMQNTYVNATAVRNKTFLDSFSNRRLYAQLLSDMLQCFTDKIGFNNTSEMINNKVLSIDSNNICALMVQANYYTKIALQELKYAGNPAVDKIPEFPHANEAYQRMLQSYARIEQTGYQDMPEEAYKDWLQSIEQEKLKESNKNLVDRQKKDVEMLKKFRKKIPTNHK